MIFWWLSGPIKLSKATGPNVLKANRVCENPVESLKAIPDLLMRGEWLLLTAEQSWNGSDLGSQAGLSKHIISPVYVETLNREYSTCSTGAIPGSLGNHSHPS